MAAFLRGGVLWIMRDNLSEDRDAYRQIAENLATYRIYGLGNGSETPRPTAYRPPLYPVLLAKLAGEGLQVTPLRVAMLHWLLGMGTVWLTWLVGTNVVLNRGQGQTDKAQEAFWLPAIAALLVACDPILLHWSTYVMTETLAAFLAILALYTLVRFHFDRRPMNAGFAGCALGLAVLCRPTFLPWAGLCGLGILFLQASGGRQSRDTSGTAKQNLISQYARRLANLAAFGFVATVMILPWSYRNYQQFGQPIITTTHGGYTFYLANNNDFFRYISKRDLSLPWESKELDARLLFQLSGRKVANSFESANDELAYHEAWEAIADQKLIFIQACLYRLGQLWSPLPHKLAADESWKRDLLRYATCAWYLGVYAAALAGVGELRKKLLRSPWVWGLLLCLVFTGVHTLYWSNLRMRAPLMPFVAIVAAYGTACVVSRVSGLRERRPTR